MQAEAPTWCSPTLTKLPAALCAAQATMRHAHKDGRNPHLKTKYATLEAVIDAVQPALTANQIAWTQVTQENSVRTVLLHASGEWLASDTPVIAGKGANAAQAYGSGLTYARRYGLSAICGITQSDDDGHAVAPAPPTPPPSGTRTPPRDPGADSLAKEYTSAMAEAVDMPTLQDIAQRIKTLSLPEAAKESLRAYYLRRREELNAA